MASKKKLTRPEELALIKKVMERHAQSKGADAKGLPLKVHFHKAPRCEKGAHDASCADHGPEVLCRVLKLPIVGKVCVCTHVKL